MKKLKSLGFIPLSLVLPLPCSFSAEPAAKDSLIKNGTMEEDADEDGWPDHWPRLKAGGSWESEKGGHFIRLKSTTPGETVLLYHAIPIPDGAKALRLSWRQRITDLKVGAQPWFDARIMLEFRDAADQKVAGAPGAPNVRKSTDGWQTKSIDFKVPEGVAVIALMPALVEVEAGTFDLDDIELRPIDP
jgi:endoglucanase